MSTATPTLCADCAAHDDREPAVTYTTGPTGRRPVCAAHLAANGLYGRDREAALMSAIWGDAR